MKLAFVGASGYGNVGDDTYPLIWADRFANDEVLSFNSDWPKNMPPDIDAIVLGGGGILYNTGAEREADESRHFQRMKFYMDWAEDRKIPWGFLSCGFQFRPNGEHSYRDSLQPWAPYLRKACFCTVRSPRCLAIAQDLSGRTDIHFFPDAAYSFFPLSIPTGDRENQVTLVPAGAVTAKDKFTAHLVRLFQSINAKIIWLGMGSPKDDEPHLDDARRLFPETIIAERQTPRSAFEQIARSRFVYSGRYHGMIFARRSGVPFLVPQSAPFKIMNEDFVAPMGAASGHFSVLESALRGPMAE
jgi:hypothetical protein